MEEATNSYRGISFAEGYNKPFEVFRAEFGKTAPFRRLDPKIREKELAKAYGIATGSPSKSPVKSVKGRQEPKESATAERQDK